MRKSPLIALLTIAIIGWAYALVSGLYPDNSQFPRVPTNPWTIGGTIAKILGVTDLATYNGTGVVANTNMLSGITATGFLHGNNCATAGNVWLRTDATGKAVCGSKNTTLASIGTVQKNTCTAKAYRADGTIANLNNGNNILEGDIIQTDPGCSLTITFADLSLIRLDGGSTVSLDIGTTTSGQSIAYAILNNGGLWWRVLTETGGYYIGSSDIVAGVRGTSINIEKYGANPAITFDVSKGRHVIMGAGGTSGGSTNLQIIHSRLPNTKMDCFGWTGVVSFSGVNRYPMHVYGIPGYCDSAKTQAESVNDAMLPTMESLYLNPRIAQNTTTDLMYMKKKSNALGNGDKKNLIDAEIGITTPTTITEKKAICQYNTTQKIYWDSLLGTDMDVCQPEALAIVDYWTSMKMYFSTWNIKSINLWTATGITSWSFNIQDDGYFAGKQCDNDTIQSGIRTQYNPIFKESNPTEYNKISNHYPIASSYSGIYLSNSIPQSCHNEDSNWFTGNDGMDRFTYNTTVYGIKNFSLTPVGGGVPITTVWQYISYPLPLFPGWASSLSGRTVKIELETWIPTPSNKAYVFDFWNWKAWIDSSWHPQIARPSWVTTGSFSCNSQKTQCSLTMTTAPGQMIIGAGYFPSLTPQFQWPIGTTIQRITISN